jgi:type IV secretory pathway ATPase VirB11/archaellum biosynthesis ATPase
MMFKEGSPLYSYEVIREAGENVLYVNYIGAPFSPSIVDYPEVMARTIDIISENTDISRLVFVQQRNYSYDFPQIKLLLGVSSLHDFLIKQEGILTQGKLNFLNQKELSSVYSFLNYIFSELLKRDPIKAYREFKGEYFGEKAKFEAGGGNEFYLKFLTRILTFFDALEIIKKTKPFFDKFVAGDREIYHEIFRADVMPNFTFTRMISQIPENAEIIKQYEIAKGYDKTVVTILKYENSGKLTYHLMPPEYLLEEEQHMLLNLARNVLVEHRPSSEEFADFERTRQVFFNVSRDLLQDLANSKKIRVDYETLNKLATILVRYTIGFGIIEVLLQDEDLQDIIINSPVSLSPVFVRHNDYDECVTNIIPSQDDADSWAAKFRMLSGRPLDEANPILDTSLNLNEIRARVAIIQNPLSPGGLAYTLRRHRTNPWTLPLFLQKKMIDGLGAGMLSFLIDGARTFLIAGTRSSGKTSLLGSLMLEIMPKYRVIVVEDTLELPVDALRQVGYDILSMKVRSALVGESVEVPANEGIRASLRLGDSSLIVGEIRSEEAKALYEAMRVGALANVVAGTIHGASPYGVFDRVVNDLGVPVTSFKATDLIVIANPIKTPDGLHSWRRVLQIAEVRKHWTKDPLEEGGFVDLMRYNVEKDKLEPTEDLINGDSEIIKSIAGNVKGWAGNWDAVWDNILLRQKIKEETLRYSKILNAPELLEAQFNVSSNNAFHQISDKINEEVGLPLSERVYPEWKKWLEKEAKRLNIS